MQLYAEIYYLKELTKSGLLYNLAFTVADTGAKMK